MNKAWVSGASLLRSLDAEVVVETEEEEEVVCIVDDGAAVLGVRLSVPAGVAI